MISYSKVFKASGVFITDEVVVLDRPLPSLSMDKDIAIDENNIPPGQQEALKIIAEAKEGAQKILEDAYQKANLLEATAKEKIDAWWEENQRKLEDLSLEANQKGYQVGLVKGREEGLSEIKKDYEEQMQQVKGLLLGAYEQKELIIAEAEPFLLELSSAIAEQILQQELHSYPEKFIQVIKNHILRVKEKESITVCVHTDDFEFVQEQRSALLSVVNGETEVKVIPDYSVTPKGCIIRTSYGSIDARIDTQLEEIKKVIIEVRKGLKHDLVS